MQRVFWAERSTAYRAMRHGSQFLTFCTKIGSSGVVKSHQILYKSKQVDNENEKEQQCEWSVLYCSWSYSFIMLSRKAWLFATFMSLSGSFIKVSIARPLSCAAPREFLPAQCFRMCVVSLKLF